MLRLPGNSINIGRALSRLMGIAVATMAGFALLGWIVGSRAMVGILPGSVPMHSFTALLLPMAALALWLCGGKRASWKQITGLFCAGAIALAGIVRLIGYSVGAGRSAEQLLFPAAFKQISSESAQALVQMAPNTSVDFVLFGAVLLIIHSRQGRLRLLAFILALTSLLVAILTISSNFINVASNGSIISYHPMAFGTAVAFCFLAVGVISALADPKWDMSNDDYAAPLDEHSLLRRSFENKVSAGFGAALMALCVLGTVSYQSISQFIGDSRWDNHTYQALASIRALHAELKDTEDAGRGYVITGDKFFIERWQTAMDRIDPALDSLSALTVDNPSQQRRIEHLKPLIEQKVDFFKTLVELRRDQGFDSARLLLLTAQGTPLMDEIRDALVEMEAEENSLLTRRVAETESNAKHSIALVSGGAAVSLILVSLAGWMIYAGVAARVRAEDALLIRTAQLEAADGTLKRQNLQLESTNKELEAFSYSVSHDLRAPLRSLDGFSQALLEDYSDKLDAKGQDYLGRVRAGSQRMGQLIDDLLNLSRVSRVEMSKELVDLSKMAHEVAGELQAASPERNAEFVVAEGLVAETDPRLMRIVLTNLLGNAWKFTAKQPHARIEFGCSGENGGKEYFMRDNGAGFDPTYSSKLFGAFQRLHAMKDFPGTGIGLATVKRIVQRQGGRVWAEGKLDQGATFHFTL